MPLNESKGNMYAFVTHTWNTVKGRCPHDCSYCYMKRWGEQKELHFDEKELKTDLGAGNFIFVGSSCDVFANEVPPRWVDKTLDHCGNFNNRYLFQTKAPQYMVSYLDRGQFPEYTTFGTTIETNRIYPQMGNTPVPKQRANAMVDLKILDCDVETILTIEPIIDFDIAYFLPLIQRIEPEWVNIGADSGGHKLPEPPAGKVLELITELSKFTEVKIKKNLNRILGRVWDQMPKNP